MTNIKNRFILSGLMAALICLTAPLTFISCDNQHPEIEVIVESDFSDIVKAIEDGSKSVSEKLALLETAIKDQTSSLEAKLALIQTAVENGFADEKTELDLIKTAIDNMSGDMNAKLSTIEEAIKSQTLSLETNFALIKTALENGFSDEKEAIELIQTALRNLKTSVDGVGDQIDEVVKALGDLETSLDTINYALTHDINDILLSILSAIKNLPDYSAVLEAIQAALENLTGTESETLAVDMGLSVKWAKYNLGATSETEVGAYIAFGETTTHYFSLDPKTWKTGYKKGYALENYKLWNTEAEKFTKYSVGVDNKHTLDPEDDAATVNWGGNWKTPTGDEWEELKNNCSWTYTKVDGVKGYRVVSMKTNNSIFLPLTGRYKEKSIDDSDNKGWYMTSETNFDDTMYLDNIKFFYLKDNEFYLTSTWFQYNRHWGFIVRPVLDE